MSNRKYPGLTPKLIEIVEKPIEEKDIFPLIDIEYKEKTNKVKPIEKLRKYFREKFISIVRSKINYEN